MGDRRTTPLTETAGVALLEALIAIALLASALIALAGLLATAASATYRANVVSTAAVLASRKMEQLRALAWSTDAAGTAVTDLSTDTSAIDQASCRPTPSSSGTGLSVSPPGALDVDTAGYVDYVDGLGCGLGGGTRPPPGTVYIRRWSVTPLPSAVDAAIVLQVVVARYDSATAGRSAIRGRPMSARLVSVKARKRS
jgi:hypothetical protein